MAKVIFGNHSSVIVPRQDRDSIRKFYCDVLGGKIMKADPERDFIRLGEDFLFRQDSRHALLTLVDARRFPKKCPPQFSMTSKVTYQHLPAIAAAGGRLPWVRSGRKSRDAY